MKRGTYPTDLTDQEWQIIKPLLPSPSPIGCPRKIRKYLGLPKEREAEYHAKQVGGHKALSVMEKYLAENQFFLGAKATIADISLYAYTHVADEGGFDLSTYINI